MQSVPTMQSVPPSGLEYDSDKGYFGVKKTGNRSKASIQELESMRARELAIGHYVLARTSIFEGYLMSSALLAEQSVELYVKALIKFRGRWIPEKMEKIHNPIALMKMAKDFPEFTKILSNPERRRFLGELEGVYGTMRFGEASISGIVSRKFASMLDGLAIIFDVFFDNIG